MMNKKIPFKKALLFIFFSVIFVSGSAFLYTGYYHYIKWLHVNDDAYKIVAIVQTTDSKEPLKTVYLAELLNLSIDQPTNLYHFHLKENQKKLLSHPLIKEAKIKRIRPGTIYVDYSLRSPIAYLIDFTNTAVDKEGTLFPFKPFFTPKKIPEIYLGLIDIFPSNQMPKEVWGKALKSPALGLAFQVMDELMKKASILNIHLKRIDVSKAFHTSSGERQIVVVLEHQFVKKERDVPILLTVQRILRLNPKHFQDGLNNYWVLHQNLEQDALYGSQKKLTVDLRLKDLGFLKKEE